MDSTAALALLAEVQRPDVTLRRLEDLVVADPTLSFRLLTLAATRAFMARAMVQTPELEDSPYTAGPLSLIDVIFASPMKDLVAELPLAEPVADALRDGTGELGELLAAIVAYERGEVHTLESLRPGELSAFVACFREASVWAHALRQQLGAA